MDIKVIGGGCSKCEKMLEAVKKAVNHCGIDADIQYVTDFSAIAGYGIMRTPALMIDGSVVLSGRVPTVGEIEKYL
ncbi:thioredoxin family protein [Megasphaera vaginalis (ex Srinivasan et al. 2021)]|uniref:Redox-active disulfide protein 2 n=1 Tax=Megasphaera vaginalis (ex Srinivasan et al. 2021) TaxID=1111454 RepID=U7UEM7_9FIRM|nr:thioredoxin family protein [Megasphaera vaginalis (ex Srinivasan et al. 2021)]ERT57805.1 redox-active disulfide protein 2 [Megasphaera vaginalis (ex Srinivasan et al. 2021)]